MRSGSGASSTSNMSTIPTPTTIATAETIERMRELVGAGEQQLENSEQRLASLRGEPAVISRPDAEGWVASQHATWRRDRDERREEGELAHAGRRHAQQAEFRTHEHWQPTYEIDHGPSFGR
jgi:hypothetical protein